MKKKLNAQNMTWIDTLELDALRAHNARLLAAVKEAARWIEGAPGDLNQAPMLKSLAAALDPVPPVEPVGECYECEGSGMNDCPGCWGGDQPPKSGICRTCKGTRVVDCHVCQSAAAKPRRKAA